MAEIEVTKTILDDLREFSAEKWKHSECELCGTDKWGVNPEPFTLVYLPTTAEEELQRGYAHASILYFPVSCLNCGNLRLIWRGIFEQWRADRKAQTTK